MVDPDRRPSAQEIEELIDLVRRDPGSPAFIDLGEAYLSLGRPRDAIQVGNLGLQANGGSMEGRVMVAKAHAALHQWKEAQGELLKVVKNDRSNRQGFALLGEVLLRRSDFDRALPVLQHAQNLDPTSPNVLTMLRRARAGEQLDPPAPIPQPVAPRGATDEPVHIQRSQRPQQRVPAAGAQMPTMAIDMAPPQYSGLDALMNVGMAPAHAAPAQPRMTKQTAPPPMSLEGVKPRIIQNAKPQNAAAASLRQSAAVGENYLNELLAGGLLDIVGVRVPDQEFNLKPDRRWSRSTRRGMLLLFVVMVIGGGGGGTWYWWHGKQQAQEQEEGNRIALGNAEYVGLTEVLRGLLKLRDEHPNNKHTYANFVYAGGVANLLYGEVAIPSKLEGGKDTPVGTAQIDAAVTVLGDGDDKLDASHAGWREYVIGNVANELAKLPTDRRDAAAATSRLSAATKLLDELLDKNKDDKWAQWAKGRSQLALGQRRSAASTFRTLADAKLDSSFSPVIAQIDLADLLTDEGKTEEALKLYKLAAKTNKESHKEAGPGEKVEEHPLVVLDEALAKAEGSIEVNETIGDLNAKFTDKSPPRVLAYRQLAVAVGSLAIEDYPTATEALAKAIKGKPPAEPRFWSRIAWVRLKIGRSGQPVDNLAEAQTAFDRCIYLGKTPEADPTMTLVEAGLMFTRGLPDKVLDVATKIEGVRPRLLRTYALLDLGKAKEALDEVTPVFKDIPNGNGKLCEEGNEAANFEARVLCEEARMLAATDDKERTAAGNVLLDLARAAKSKLGRHALGVASLQVGNLVDAKEHLGQAVKDINEQSPNPLEYRTRTALAEVALLEGDLAGAEKYAREAGKIDPSYLPAKAELARVLVRSKPDEAEALLKPVLAELAAANLPMVKLAQAEVLATKSPARNRDKIETLLGELKDKPGIRQDELGRIALLVDPKLPEKLGVPVPGEKKSGADPKSPTPAPVPPPKRRPGKR